MISKFGEEILVWKKMVCSIINPYRIANPTTLVSRYVFFNPRLCKSWDCPSSIIKLFLKQGYEDWVRHRGDGAINRKLVTQVDTESVNQIHVFESCFSNKICTSFFWNFNFSLQSGQAVFKYWY